MTERTFTAAEMRQMADEFANVVWDGSAHTPSYLDIIAMLRQSAAAIERWEALDTWLDSKMVTAHTAGESSYVAGAIDMRELTQAEMARLERA